MQDHPPGPVTDPCDSAQLVTDIMYDGALTCCSNLRATNAAAVRPVPRSEGEGWQRILDEKDDKALWKAIIWKGEYQVAPGGISTDEEFKAHMETLLYPADSPPLELDPNVLCPYVPVLDDLFQVEEVKEVLTSQVKPSKSAGPDGVSPGVFRLLATQWIIHLTVLFNSVFTGLYPKQWTYAKLSMLFKKGATLCCDSYRGISVINAISKVYDYLLCNRLRKWFTSDREQAGAQPKRGATYTYVLNI